MALTKKQKTVIGASLSTAAILIPLQLFLMNRRRSYSITPADIRAVRTKDDLEAYLERKERDKM